MPLVPIMPEVKKQRGPTTLQTERVEQGFGTQVSTAVTQGASQLGQILQRHAEERDDSQARDSFNSFRREARNQMNDLRSRRGKDAYGSQKEYDNWYAENSTKAGGSLGNDRQRAIFNQLSGAKLESDAETMSVFEIEQHFRYVETVYQDTLSSAVSEVSADPLNERVLQEELIGVKMSLDNARKGMDNGAEYAKAASSLVITAIQGQLALNPLKASRTLEKYKDELGAAYPGLKNEVDSESILQVARAAAPGDFDAQYDFIMDREGLDESVRATALGRVNALQSETLKRKKVAREERRDVSEDGVFEALNNGNTLDAVRLIGSLPEGDWSEREKYNMYNLTKSRTTKTDPIAEKTLQVDILRGKIPTVSALLDRPETADLTAESIRALKNEINTYNKDSEAASGRISKGEVLDAVIRKWDKITASGTDLEQYAGEKGTFILEFKTQLDEAEKLKGSPLTPTEIRDNGADLLRTRVDDRGFWRSEVQYNRMLQIIDPEKYPPTLKETNKPSATQASSAPQAAVSPADFTGMRGAPRGAGQAPQKAPEEMPKSPEVGFVEGIPPEVKLSIVNALARAKRPLYYRDIWKLYSDKYPEEAKRISEEKGL